MRRVRSKLLRKELKLMLGDKPITNRIWRHHKKAYKKGLT